MLTIALPVFLFIFILSYSYYKTKNLLRGVILEVNDVKDGQVFNQPLINLSGRAKNATRLYINGREISIDKNASFTEKMLLLTGYNVLTIKAEDKFGKKIEKDYKLNLI